MKKIAAVCWVLLAALLWVDAGSARHGITVASSFPALSNVNNVRNNIGIGAGSGAAASNLPYFWSGDFSDTAHGVTVTSNGPATDGGIRGVSYSISGTYDGAGRGNDQWVVDRFVENGNIARILGFYFRVTSGSATGCAVNTFANTEDTGGNYTATLAFTARSVSGTGQTFTSTYTTGASTGYVNTAFQISYSPGAICTMTLFVGLAGDERGSTFHSTVNPGSPQLATNAFFSQSIPDSYFGTHIEGPTASNNAFPYVAGHSNYNRGHAYSPDIRWDGTRNSGPGSFNLATYTTWFNAMSGAGISLYYTFGTGECPSWVSALGQPCTNPDTTAWQNWVTQIVTAGVGKIKYYEIWNEADSATYYTGTIAGMVTRAQYVYTKVKSLDPTAIVLCPSTTGSTNGMGWFRDFLVAGGGNWCDRWAFHNYIQVASPRVPELIAPNATQFAWVAATNWPTPKLVHDSESSFADNPNVQDDTRRSSYVGKQYILTWSAGYQSSYWYALDNSTFGTFYNLGTLTYTPAATAYTQVRSWLLGATMTGPASAVLSDVWTASITRSGGYSGQIVWNRGGSTSYTVPGGMVRYRDLSGGSTVTTGGASITITDSPILLENQ